jgi:hypothetical protein
MWFKIKSYLNQNLLVSSSPFSSTLCMLLYDVFPICIYFIKICIALSVMILKHVVTSHFHCLCYPFSVQKFFSPSSCLFLFQQYVYLFCSLHKGQLLISVPLLMHLNFQIPSPVSVVHSTTIYIYIQIPPTPPSLLLYMIKEFELRKKPKCDTFFPIHCPLVIVTVLSELQHH